MTKSATLITLALFVLMKWKDLFLSINTGLILWVCFLCLLVVGTAKMVSAQFSQPERQAIEHGVYISALIILIIQEVIF